MAGALCIDIVRECCQVKVSDSCPHSLLAHSRLVRAGRLCWCQMFFFPIAFIPQPLSSKRNRGLFMMTLAHSKSVRMDSQYNAMCKVLKRPFRGSIIIKDEQTSLRDSLAAYQSSDPHYFYAWSDGSTERRRQKRSAMAFMHKSSPGSTDTVITVRDCQELRSLLMLNDCCTPSF